MRTASPRALRIPLDAHVTATAGRQNSSQPPCALVPADSATQSTGGIAPMTQCQENGRLFGGGKALADGYSCVA